MMLIADEQFLAQLAKSADGLQTLANELTEQGLVVAAGVAMGGALAIRRAVKALQTVLAAAAVPPPPGPVPPEAPPVGEAPP